LFLILGGIFLGLVFATFHPSGRAFLIPPLRANRPGCGQRRILTAVFAICLTGIWFVLKTGASTDVRSDSDEIAFYLAMCAGWLLLTVLAFEYMGVSVRDDVAGRRNWAATAALCGLMAGETFSLAGANTGNGPGPEVVVLCGAITTAVLFLLWSVLNAFAGIVDIVTIEREPGAGIRAAGFLAGSGAILGAAVAGDWISLEQTLRDFVYYGWPVFVVLVVAISVEKLLAKQKLSQTFDAAVSTAFCALNFSLCTIYALRMWSRA